MVVLARIARAVLPLALLLPGCAQPGGPDPAPPEVILPLELSVDRLDVSHGALRLFATMTEGAAGVSVTLGEACGRREVGGGMSTLSTLVWTLDEGEVADAVACGLVVRTHVRTADGRVTKEVEVPLGVGVYAGEENAEEDPQVRELAIDLDGVTLTFDHAGARAHLSVGDSLLEPAVNEGDDPDDLARRFVASRRDFVRSLLMHWPLRLDGAAFDVSLSIRDVVLDADEGGLVEEGELVN